MEFFSEKLIINEKICFPDYKYTYQDIIGIGGDYNPYRLLLAYSLGIFPWPSTEEEDIYWFFPFYRFVLYPQDFKLRKSLKQSIRNKGFELRVDTAFAKVMDNCAQIKRKGQDDTWIFKPMQKAYTYLHELGLAHSIEIWQNNELVGGLYGISLGGIFFGESMFSKVSDASKAALFFLCQQAQQWNFKLIDAQVYTEHLESLGATEIYWDFFLEELKQALKMPTKHGKWTNWIDYSLFEI